MPISLHKIVNEIKEENRFKKDVFVLLKNLSIDKRTALLSSDVGSFELSDWACHQLCQRIDIPYKYYKSCPNELKALNANHWLSSFSDSERKVVLRVRDTSKIPLVRGIVTNRYKAFDDHEVLEVLHHHLGSEKDYQVSLWDSSDEGFHLRIIMNDLVKPIGKTLDGKSDVHKIGIHVENSEVGKKSIRIRPMIYRLVCTNGLLTWQSNGEAFQQKHIHLDHETIREKISAAVSNALKTGETTIEFLSQAKETPVDNPISVIEKLSKEIKGMTKELSESVKSSFLLEPGSSAFYIVQAFTNASKHLELEQRAEMEALAGRILERLIA